MKGLLALVVAMASSQVVSAVCTDCDGESGTCSWIGDGFCDDGTYGENWYCAEYNYDDGDCGSVCTDCDGESGTCSWIGDGFCDDGTYGENWYCAEYNYDDGDCGSPTTTSAMSDTTTSNSLYCTDCDGDTSYCFWVGDGYCDHSNSVFGVNFNCVEYNYDGGDCSYGTYDDAYYAACEDCDGYSGYCSWIGDGICDSSDAWFNYDCAEYNYDGGDCDSDCTDCDGESGTCSWVGDGFCDDGTYGENWYCAEYNYDDGDCGSFCTDCDGESGTCSWIGDGFCDDGTYGENWYCAEYNYDDGDCDYYGAYYGDCTDCDGESGTCSWVGDGWCDDGSWGQNWNCAEYNYDDGDCDYYGAYYYDCTDCDGQPGYCSWIGDGVCDHNTSLYGQDFDCAEFNYDGGDCNETDYANVYCYDCDGYLGYCSWVGDGYCHESTWWGYNYNCASYNYDGGDCNATSDYYCTDCDGDQGYCSWIGDGVCDHNESIYGQNFDCEEFDFDGGDCNDTDTTSYYCYDCSGNLGYCSWVGDGYCHGENSWWYNYNCSDYSFDGGDCEDFYCVDCNGHHGYCSWVGDGVCDHNESSFGQNFDCAEFNYDGGDCHENATSDYYCTDCEGSTGYCSWIGDSWCDDHSSYWNYNCADFNYDGGDCDVDDYCVDCEGEPGYCSWVGDGVCDHNESIYGQHFDCAEYNYDAGDCSGGNTTIPSYICVDCDGEYGYCSFVGDGWCDHADSFWGQNFYCEEYNYDDGDCEDYFYGGYYAECDDCNGDGGYCSWVGDGICDDASSGWGSDYNCETWNYDGGDCQTTTTTTTLGACPATCFEETCDYWTDLGELCSELESEYSCDCTECETCGIEGCTDPDACNYDEDATVDNGSCAELDQCGTCGGEGAGGDTTLCEKKSWRDDGLCDDGNNNCGCGWDGGDCCGADNSYAYCDDCVCLDPDLAHCGGYCSMKALQGDGYCDDSNNNCGCDWDGGDCCGASDYNYCVQCLCSDPEFTTTTTTTTAGATGCGGSSCNSGCFKNAWQGDGFCDDANNVCGCDWDGGDCCGTETSFAYCEDCECLDCDYASEGDDCVDVATGSCQKAAWSGDGYCDDGNNNAGCDWDGGDCCGDASLAFCDVCECLDCTYVAGGDDCVDSIQGVCWKANYAGDGYCDDGNNNAGCDWDQGDCCGSSGKGQQFAFCDDCACRDCTYIAGDDCVDSFANLCQKEAWKGDGFCDDGNNNGGCAWDGGDCCGTDANTNYCTECECLDCTYEAEGDDCVDSIQGSCSKPAWQGDGFCDDNNNNAGCDWDGGDCCGGSTAYCSACECLDCTAACAGVCEKNAWKGDGFCDDGNNLCGCDWDGGDCCGASGSNLQYSYCDSCECLDPDASCSGICFKNGWKGDGYCDDNNNLCGCDWDGGDCCGSAGGANQFAYCTDCACLDPNA